MNITFACDARQWEGYLWRLYAQGATPKAGGGAEKPQHTSARTEDLRKGNQALT